jgi:histidine triad (HIT) family protein
MESIFTKIVKGKIPCYKVAETEECLAFLDTQPLAKGHTLVIPKKEVDFYYDLEDTIFEKVNALSKKVAHALKKNSCLRKNRRFGDWIRSASCPCAFGSY